MVDESVIRILIADDHPIVREGIVSIIQRRRDMQVVAEATNGKEALELFRQHKPDVALMDVRMPQVDGPEAILAIRKEFPKARIIILTTYDGDEYVFQALRAGAKAFLLKDSPREHLLEAIRAVHAGQTFLPQEMATKLAARMSRPELTAREQAVLRLMTAGKTNHDIASELFIAEATVKSHVNSILSKMQVNDRTQAVTLALKRGLVSLE
jgi:two-component system, NarL family, response regulator